MAQLPGEPRVNQYTSGSGQTTFTYDFQIYADDEITVQKNGTILTLTTDYTVTDAGDEDGGTVVLVAGASGGDIITLTGNTMVERNTEFTDGGEFAANAINGEYNKLDNLVSELVSDATKYLQFKTYDEDFDTKIASPTANRCIMVNSDGDGLEMSTYNPDSAQGDAEAFAAAAAVSAVEAAISESAAAASASDASDSADDAAASAVDAENYANSINPSAFASDFIPDADDTRDLGSAAKQWAEVRCMDAYVGDDLSVTDDASIGGDLTLTGGLTVNTDKFTIAADTGNTVIDGTLSVGGTNIMSPKIAQYSYSVAYDTYGGSYSTANTWTIRPINTEVEDTIGATLFANRVTLPAGTYFVNCNAAVHGCSYSHLRVYDYTNSTTLVTGAHAFSGDQHNRLVSGFFILADEAQIEVDMNATGTEATQAMGLRHNTAAQGNNIYLTLSILQIA